MRNVTKIYAIKNSEWQRVKSFHQLRKAVYNFTMNVKVR